MENQQNTFSGWAIVEMMGHRREIGFVTTENYGAAALFRIDTPGQDEREYVTPRPCYAGNEWVPAGSTVQRQAVPPRSVLIGPGSVYALNPCTEEAAREAIDSGAARPLILLKLPDRPQIEEMLELPSGAHD